MEVPMKGWLILRHSLRQVFGNLGGALRVSGVLYLVQFVVGLLVGGGMAMGDAATMMQNGGPGGGFFLGVLVSGVIAVISGLWIAVGWHRYVLLGETSGLVPSFSGDRIWAYFLRALGYAVILIVIGAIWGGIVGFVVGSIFGNSIVLMLILMGLLIYLPVLVISFRMTSDLPSAALDAGHPFMSGWTKTAGATTDLAVMAAIIVVAVVVLGVIASTLLANLPIFGVVWALVMGWVQMMVGVSILTTLYGHYVEKRDLV
jgi:hypothetical protein